jgi:putative ABC transport system permease protein
MLRNYVTTALRTLRKDKTHSLINIIGLSVGMAVAMLIGLWIADEVNFNKQFANYNRTAQVIQNVSNNGEVQTWFSLPYPLAEDLRKTYGSDFKQVVMGLEGDFILKYNDNKLKEQGYFFEPGAPELFSLHMLKGTRNGLEDPTSIMLDASTAKAFFGGNEDPIGKIIKINDMPVVKVTGVYEDFPHNSALADVHFMSTWQQAYNNIGIKTITDPWRPNFASIFVQLTENADFAAVSQRIKDAKLKRVNAQLAKKKPELFLLPMSRWHLYSEFKDGKNVGGAIQYVWMFGMIGLFVLLLACINFMNLSTARSEKRAKEVGIRKTLGSMRGQLILQFFSESLLTVLFAYSLSLILVKLALPLFNSIADKQMDIPWSSPAFWGMSIATITLTALVAGSYPALYLSGFQPVKVLKGYLKAGKSASIPRQVLVILQFTVSVTLIIGTVTVYRQIQYAKDRPVGYSRANIISIPSGLPIHDHFKAVKDALSRTGAIADIIESGGSPTDIDGSTSGISWEGKDPNLSTDFGEANVSAEYGRLIGWHLVAGRDFNKDLATDSAAVIMNESAIRFMGLKKPVGASISWFDKKLTILGVSNDMLMGSPYDEVHPMVFNLLGPKDAGDVVLVRLNPAMSAAAALDKIAPVFRQFNPILPFEYRFLDDDYARKFSNEARIGEMAAVFAALAVLISCLGLFGLTSFVAEQRKKEIGMRKVLGASVLNIWNLLSRDFIVLVGLSFLVAIPVSWFLMRQWLQSYHYRAPLSVWIFAAAGSGAIIITLLVVSLQTIRSAMANPIRSLRSE